MSESEAHHGKIAPGGIYDAFRQKVPSLNVVLKHEVFMEMFKSQLTDGKRDHKTLGELMDDCTEKLKASDNYPVAQFKYPVVRTESGVYTPEFKPVFLPVMPNHAAEDIIRELNRFADAYEKNVKEYAGIYQSIVESGSGLPYTHPKLVDVDELRGDIKRHKNYFNAVLAFAKKLKK